MLLLHGAKKDFLLGQLPSQMRHPSAKLEVNNNKHSADQSVPCMLEPSHRHQRVHSELLRKDPRPGNA